MSMPEARQETTDMKSVDRTRGETGASWKPGIERQLLGWVTVALLAITSMKLIWLELVAFAAMLH